jgi:hypothetical protein
MDPDRNVSLTAEDTVLVSAEVNGRGNDVEVYVLKETGKNTSVFRGYINTQPGAGRQVQGKLEMLTGDEVRFSYVDLANATGARNVIDEFRLPVVTPIAVVAAKK